MSNHEDSIVTVREQYTSLRPFPVVLVYYITRSFLAEAIGIIYKYRDTSNLDMTSFFK